MLRVSEPGNPIEDHLSYCLFPQDFAGQLPPQVHVPKKRAAMVTGWYYYERRSLPYPDAPWCWNIYLYTFTPKMAQMWVDIPYKEHLG